MEENQPKINLLDFSNDIFKQFIYEIKEECEEDKYNKEKINNEDWYYHPKRNYVNYVKNTHGIGVERQIDGDFILVPIYDIECKVPDFKTLLKNYQNKLDDDGWYTILTAGMDQYCVHDSNIESLIDTIIEGVDPTHIFMSRSLIVQNYKIYCELFEQSIYIVPIDKFGPDGSYTRWTKDKISFKGKEFIIGINLKPENFLAPIPFLPIIQNGDQYKLKAKQGICIVNNEHLLMGIL